jgi:hypothetical protein
MYATRITVATTMMATKDLFPFADDTGTFWIVAFIA